MPKLIPLAKDVIILYTACTAVTGLALLAKDTAKLVVDKIQK